MARSGLRSLPPEVLQNIAAYGSALDIFNLGITCRQLHSACETMVVYRTSAISRLPALDDTNDDRDAVLARLKAQMAGGPQGDFARWRALSIAISQAERFRAASPFSEGEEPREPPRHPEAEPPSAALEWAAGSTAALAALGYPQACYSPTSLDLQRINTYKFRKQVWCLDDDSKPRVVHLQLAFCLGCAVLQLPRAPISLWGPLSTNLADAARSIAAEEGEEQEEEEEEEGPPYIDWLHEDIAHCLLAPPRPNKHVSRRYIASWEGSLAQRMQVVGVIAYKQHLSCDGYGLPLIERLPFARVPPPSAVLPVFDADPRRGFRADAESWVAWLQGCADDMAASLFDGDWQGCCLKHPGLRHEMEEQLRGIQFLRRPSPDGHSADEGALVRLTAAPGCLGMYGPFGLDGCLNKRTRRVEFLRQNPAHNLQYEGVFTPFGICGWYGHVLRGDMVFRHGVFWLWKTEWC